MDCRSVHYYYFKSQIGIRQYCFHEAIHYTDASRISRLDAELQMYEMTMTCFEITGRS